MSSPETNGEDTSIALKIYASFLHERNQALTDIARTSHEMCSMLKCDATTDVKDILARRELECLRFTELCKSHTASDMGLIRDAENAARSGSKEVVSVAMSVLTLHEDSQDLTGDIMTCQTECESILKTRLATTARALRQSTQRRKLNEAYGPAVRRGAPVFMDKQT